MHGSFARWLTSGENLDDGVDHLVMEHAEAALNELVGGEVEASSKRVVEQAWFADALDGEGAELRMEMKGRAQRQWTPPMEMKRVGAVSVDPPRWK